MQGKLEGLGVYDLKGLVVGLSILNSEAGTHSGALVASSMNLNGCGNTVCASSGSKGG